jgi:hypothetical protein
MELRRVAWDVLAFTHRWLGAAVCLLILLWFASGIAMMYVRMPSLTEAERFAHRPALEASTINISLADAASRSGAPLEAVQLTTLGNRPVYRFFARAVGPVFADTGERWQPPSPDDALAIARRFAPEHASTLRYLGLLAQPDQWTLQSRVHLPLHHVALGDEQGTEIYVSSQTGDVVMEATARERFWGYVGPVAHWLYWPVLRRNSALWADVIIYSSIAGCLLCVLGLTIGVVRLSPARRFSRRGKRVMSPYTGWMKWHHYAGLIFGVTTFTWTFSGLLSMGPFPLLSSGGATADQQRAVIGAVSGARDLTVDAVRAAIRSAQSVLQPKELALIFFRDRSYWLVSESPSRHVLVDAEHPDDGPFDRFEEQSLRAIVGDAVPGAAVTDVSWLSSYDDYYYDRTGERPLPVLRVRYDDAQHTWLYLDPGRGAIALVVRREDRLNRWLYHGLHSLDFKWLYGNRPAWDVMVIALSLGGIAGAVSSIAPLLRRLGGHATRRRRR